MKERVKYLDWVKGFAIILMLYGHTSGNEDWSQIWVYSFHMPLFFIIGGVLLSMRNNYSNLELSEFVPFCVRRFRQLLVPYFIWGLLYCVFFALLTFIDNGIQPAVSKFLHLQYMLVTMRETTSLWFIPCYLFADILLFIIIGLFNKFFGGGKFGGYMYWNWFCQYV